ncbi:hypothetical protein [Polycyclovorans algicola]|jgi:hypothetical protein|uniref:hypothetical protein n=1 Tax=Polycyclovorans algicola TaxID=616992 RepID=UPI00126836F6|nr:hypothetical protein [Polycyclovorans algicola]|tara:strand:- start:17000 stop:17464 length:465 start_codon:yes stop_codon:yes gene_type:complete
MTRKSKALLIRPLADQCGQSDAANEIPPQSSDNPQDTSAETPTPQVSGGTKYEGTIRIIPSKSGETVTHFTAEVQKSSSAKYQAKKRAKLAAVGKKQINLVVPEETHGMFKSLEKLLVEHKLSPEMSVLTPETFKGIISLIEELMDELMEGPDG